MRAGLVTPSTADSWLGGHYIVQSLFLATQHLPPELRPSVSDVWWQTMPPTDPFAEVRDVLGEPVIVRMPDTIGSRAVRAVRRRALRSTGAGDLFRAAGVDVLFPVRPIEEPGIPFVFHLPDVQYRHLTNVNDERTARWFDDYFHSEGTAAARIHLSSENVRRDVETFFPELLSKARVVFPVAVPTPVWWSADPAEVAAKHSLPKRYFVVSNQVSAHKNHLAIGRALSALRSRNVDAEVICTGRTADYRDANFFPSLQGELERLGVTSRMRFLGVLPRAEQIAVMRGAVALLQPSHFEGWGAAVAEARTLGKPLIASDLPINHEHNHPDATWVAADDIDGWADAMQTAWRERSPGPIQVDEEEARALTERDAREVGRRFTDLLTEAARG